MIRLPSLFRCASYRTLNTTPSLLYITRRFSNSSDTGGFDTSLTKKLVRNSTLALCSKFITADDTEQVLSTSALTCVTTQPKGKYHPRLHFVSFFFYISHNKAFFDACYIGTAHVTHPFLYPKYYSPDKYGWIYKLTHSDVFIYAQIREVCIGFFCFINAILTSP